MDAMQEFVERILKPEQSFFIPDGKNRYFFVQGPLGMAVAVYGCYMHGQYDKIAQNLSLLAIVVEHVIYLADNFPIKSKDQYAQVKKFTDVAAKYDAEAKNEVFPVYYNKLRATDYRANDSTWRTVYHTNIRNYMFGKIPKIIDISYYFAKTVVIDIDAALRIFCGLTDLESETRLSLEKKIKQWLEIKRDHLAVAKVISEGLYLEMWERKMNDILQNSDAKQVTIYIEAGGVEYPEKIERERLLKILRDDNVISNRSFLSSESGKRFLAKLGKEYVHCSQIKKITYDSMILYQQPESLTEKLKNTDELPYDDSRKKQEYDIIRQYCEEREYIISDEELQIIQSRGFIYSYALWKNSYVKELVQSLKNVSINVEADYIKSEWKVFREGTPVKYAVNWIENVYRVRFDAEGNMIV